jgi:hypothetical protein
MKDIICIDLTKFNKDKLVEVAKFVKIEVDSLLINKKEGFAKIFINNITGKVIAYTTKKDKKTILYTEDMRTMLDSMESVNVVKQPKTIILSVDRILDKISKYGVESLHVNEKKFLDSSK